MRTERRRIARSTLAGISLVLIAMSCPSPAMAQRQSTLGASVSFVGGLDNNGQPTLPGQPTQMDPMYSVYPGLTLQSRGARSTMDLGYAFGWNRVQSTLPTNSKSHSVSFNLSTGLSSTWNLKLGENFSLSDDLQTFYALQGVEVLEQQLVFYFQPVATEQSVRTNRTSVALDHTLNARSSISFSGDHTLADYRDNSGVGLSDQHTSSAGISYSRQITEHTNWALGYTASYFKFEEFNTAVSNVVHIGLSSTVAKDTVLSVSAGPSHVKNLHSTGSNLSYQASASLAKRIKENSFHVSVSHDNSNATGLGSISSTRRVSGGYSRTFKRRFSLFADVSAFDSKGVLGNPYSVRGTSATANLGVSLVSNLWLQAGAHFQRYTQSAPYDFSQKRVFASLRYSLPNLLRSN